MKILYAKNNYIERENQRHIDVMKSVLSTCVRLDLCCLIENDVIGIWFFFNGEKYLVDPLELINSIFEDDLYYMFDSSKDGGKEHNIVEVHKDEYCYTWRIFGGESKSSINLQFSFREYVDRIKAVVEAFSKVWHTGKTVVYEKNDITIESIDIAVAQLNIMATMPSYYQLKTSDVKEEEFVFDVLSHKHLEKYTIGVGKRCFSSWITHWDSDFGKTRHEFETFCYEHEANIELSFDMSKTIVKIRRVSVIEEIKESDEGCGFSYKDYALVEIIPNEFVKMPIIKGYCDLTKTIRTLYEGLLHFAMKHPIGRAIDYEPLQREIYNMLKSPLIEKVITNVKRDFNKADIRQYLVKRILRICPDYDAVIWDSENETIYIDECGNIDELYDHEGGPIVLKELVEWQKEIRPIVISSETGERYEKNWEDYHKRGLDLAKRLRNVLSNDFDLWYEAPFEDKSGVVPKPILIM